WDKDAKPHYFDVDHKHEIQLGGTDAPTNMWLLDAEANQTSGSNISAEISQKVSALLAEAHLQLGNKVPGSAMDARKDYAITIETVTGRLSSSGNPAAHWEVDDIQAGKPLEKLKVLSEKEAKARNLVGPGTESRLMIFTSARGGSTTSIPWDPATNNPKAAGPWPIYRHFHVDTVAWDGSQGSITGTGFKENRFLDPLTLTLPMTPHGAVAQAAVVNGRDVESKLRSLQLKGLSPIEITFAEMRDPNGIYMKGQVLPDVPLIASAGIDLVVDGNDVYLEKVFSAADFKFPGPIQVKDASLALAAGTIGLRVSGEVRFEIPRVGKGSLGASATATGTGVGLALEGQFDFDPGLFDPAQIKVWYRDQKFGARGEIGVPPGKVRGLKSANVTLTFEEERIEAKGTFEPDIKGVQSGELSMTYVEGTGLQMAGTLKLSNEVPGLNSGTIEASVKQKGEEWSLAGAITAEAGIPGITATVTGSYEDGGWQVEGTAGYEKGFLKGTVTIGATNRPVGEDGRPAGEGSEKLSAYGGGEVTLKLAPWLQGTVGLKIRPDGNMIVSGKVGLPSAFELFPEKKVQKNIFSINIDIPIVGFTVLGQRVGIFATIGGGLDAEAGIGPGQLRQAELGVTYDPANEAATTVTGAAQLYIPANAGLHLFVRGGIGAGIPIVSATAGLEVGGRLGIVAALQSDLQVNWTPATGLVLDTVLQAYAQPKFKFDITGFVEVTVDYFIGSSTLYEKKWELAAFEYGSDLRFGLRLPVHYEEGKAFDVSLSDIEFEYPQIEPSELLAGLVKQLA
ncbi:MAG: hypothetical protein M3377_05700, partial [Actinomycetota bacterium]|nr:hypothetical protein [Actinomycetota bacterium]